MVHGNPSFPNGPSAAQGFQNVVSTPAPQYIPAAPQTPIPTTGPDRLLILTLHLLPVTVARAVLATVLLQAVSLVV